MNIKIITAIAFKLFGIYFSVLAIYSIPTLAFTVFSFKSQSIGSNSSLVLPVFIIGATIIGTAIAIKILWALGNGVLKDASEIGKVDDPISGLELQKSLFIILGLYFLISAALELPNAAVKLWAYSNTEKGITYIEYTDFMTLMAELIIGLSLINRLDKWVLVIRSIGSK